MPAPAAPSNRRTVRSTASRRGNYSALEAIRNIENAVTASSEVDGVVLCYGAFYGPATGLFDRRMIDQLRRRRVPLIGDANDWWSFLHIDDAAAATAIAVERGVPGIDNIADDESTAGPRVAAGVGGNAGRSAGH